MDESKLNKFALKIAKDLMKAKKSIPLTTGIAVANYKMAQICANLGIQLDTKSGFGKTPANIYQLTLLGSGQGKGASLGLADNFYFRDALDYIGNEVYPKFKRKALDKLETEENERPLHSWVKAIGSTTESGLLAYAESYSIVGFGGISIEIDEIGNAVTSKADVFELLLSPYDNGMYIPTAKRTDPDAMSVSGMCTNLYCFGNKVRLFEGDNVETAFIKLLDEGYARRMIFIDDNTIPERRSADDVVKEMIASEEIIEKRKPDREFIKSLITRENLFKTIVMSKEAIYVWATIKADGDNYLIDNRGLEPAIKSDMAERVFKTAKLASIYAFFEESNEIEARHMNEAFEVIKESSNVLSELRKVKPIHHRLLEKLLDEEKPVTSSHILSYGFINSTWTKKVNDYIDLARELASERGYLWKSISRKGVDYYSVSKPTEEETEELDEIDSLDKNLSHDELMDLLS